MPYSNQKIKVKADIEIGVYNPKNDNRPLPRKIPVHITPVQGTFDDDNGFSGQYFCEGDFIVKLEDGKEYCISCDDLLKMVKSAVGK